MALLTRSEIIQSVQDLFELREDTLGTGRVNRIDCNRIYSNIFQNFIGGSREFSTAITSSQVAIADYSTSDTIQVDTGTQDLSVEFLNVPAGTVSILVLNKESDVVISFVNTVLDFNPFYFRRLPIGPHTFFVIGGEGITFLLPSQWDEVHGVDTEILTVGLDPGAPPFLGGVTLSPDTRLAFYRSGRTVFISGNCLLGVTGDFKNIFAIPPAFIPPRNWAGVATPLQADTLKDPAGSAFCDINNVGLLVIRNILNILPLGELTEFNISFSYPLF